MNKTLILILLCSTCFGTQAQTPEVSQTPEASQILTFPEPEFVGHVLAILPGDKTKPVAQESLSPRHRSSTGATLFGIGRTHISEMVLNSPKAAMRFNPREGVAFIVKVIDNQMDPMSELSIFRFKTTKKLRLAEYSSEGTFGDRQSNTLEYQPFTARKFGANSYLVVLENPQPGEYGITVNAIGSLNVSTFGIDK